MRICVGRLGSLLCLALLVGRTSAIETAGELFVHLEAATYTTGDSIWENLGTYADFDAIGGPTGGFVESTPAVWFNGSADAFAGQQGAPGGLVGSDPTSTVEAWVFNPLVASEETVVAWSRRGGPDGTNMSFNYGTNQDFGAVGHWGDDYDMGWQDPPDADQWHHLTYTHDGTTLRAYIDGALNNQKNLVGLMPYDDQAIALGAQWKSNGGDLERWGSLAIGRLRIHDDVLTDAQILANYEEERSAFVGPPPPMPEPLSDLPIHRYGFGEGTDAGFVFDSIGGAHGEIIGDGWAATDGTLSLDGGDMNTAAYADLPNGIISSLTDATIETWVTVQGAENTPRFFSFGSSAEGELEEPGGSGADQDVLTLSVTRGSNLGRQNLAIKNQDPAFGGSEEGDVGAQDSLNTTIQTPLDEEIHIAFVYDSEGGAEGGPALLHYRDGELVTSFDVTVALGNLNDVNNWIGRSNNTGEGNFQGLFNEFRIYDYPLSINEIVGNIEAGPDVLNLGIERIPGDANGDGKVDAADLNALGLNWRMSDKTYEEGDFDGDGTVDAADLNILAINWQFGVDPAAAASAVPEPATLWLVGTLLLGMLATRRRRH